MPSITKPYGDFVNNVDVADATKVNGQMNAAYNALNGGLDSFNVPTLGDVTTLTTTVKDKLVNAINEVNTKGTIDFMSRQAFIDGGFDVWSRLPSGSTSFTTPGAGSFTADRWAVAYDGTIGTFTVSRQPFALGQTDVPSNPKYFLRWDQTVAGSGSTFRGLFQKIEGSQLFSGGKCTLSFYAKCDSARSITVTLRQNFGTGGTPSAGVDSTSSNFNLTTNWQKFTYTYTLPNTAGKTLGTNGDDCLQVIANFSLNTIMTLDFSEFQLNAGDSALPFQPRSFAEEENASLRYNRRIGGSLSPVVGTGIAISTTQAYIFVPFGIKMRIVVPTLTTSGLFFLFNGSTLTQATAMSIDTNQSQLNGVTLLVTVASGLTAGQALILRPNSDATAYLNLDAEL